MIKTIIFDFGDVFINLDKPATKKAVDKLGTIEWDASLHEVLLQYEVGSIDTANFINHFLTRLPNATKEDISTAWNAILKDFPTYRLEFIKKLAEQQEYQLILLSNTNELHINWIIENIPFYEVFKNCFEAFYLSHEINLRKPDAAVFEFILEKHQLQASETLFIDDTSENTEGAAQLGIHVWNNNPATEDVIDLFTIKSELF